MLEIFTFENLIAFLTLAGLEIILGIDNIIFIAITTARLPVAKRAFARRMGLALAMGERILLVSFMSWMAHLTEPLFSFGNFSFSGRDLILLLGGLFLLGKATTELHTMTVDGEAATAPEKVTTSMAGVFLQIVILDTIFSLDSVITAVGMVNNLTIMVAAIVVSVLVMMAFANPLSEFILRHPTLKVLALSFLILVGVFLIAEGFGNHIEKGYIYFAMAFSIFVEFVNSRTARTAP
jgi:predicted tellurium resistance membrane protein TerC